MPRVAIIHALLQSIAPVNAEMERTWPSCERMNLVDDSLSTDRAREASGLTERFMGLADYAVLAGAQGLLFSCSAFGPQIEDVVRRYPDIPVLAPNEAMIAEVVAHGGRIGVIATFAATLQSLPANFLEMADVRTALADGALEALQAGDVARHDDLVVASARRLASQGCSVIALAQFSTARSATRVADAVQLPVASPVASAVRAMRHRLDPS